MLTITLKQQEGSSTAPRLPTTNKDIPLQQDINNTLIFNFMNKKTLLLMLAACATVASAQNVSSMKSRTPMAKAAKTHVMSLKTISEGMMKKGPQLRVIPNESDFLNYGTEVVLVEEDFSKFTKGSFGNPDLDTDIQLDPETHTSSFDWDDLDPQYTAVEGWNSGNMFMAGGMGYFVADEAHINTPVVDGSANDAICIMQFKARCPDGMQAVIAAEAVDVDNYNNNWTFYPSTAFAIDDQWRVYEAVFKDCLPWMMFNIYNAPYDVSDPYNPLWGEVYVDDIKVYQIKQHIGTPVMLPYTNYKGTNVDLNWKAVEGAESYIVNVYKKIDDYTLQEFKTNIPATGTTYHLEGLESGATYYYTLSSVKGEYQSIETSYQEIFDLEAPVLNKVNNLKDDGTYTASWKKVPTAERYNYWAYCERVADADGEFTVTDEDFTGIRDPQGNLTGWTVENPSYNTYDNFYCNEMKQAGWVGQSAAPYTDYYCVDGYHYMSYVNPGFVRPGLISPELDLSKDGGKFKFSVKLLGEYFEIQDWDDNLHKGITQGTVVLSNYDEATGEYVVAETVELNNVTNSWQDFTAEFTKGSARSQVALLTTEWDFGNLYIDDLKITQNYKAGEMLFDPFKFMRWVEGETVNIQLTDNAYGFTMKHKVAAVKVHPTEGYYKQSAFSEMEEIGKVTSSIEGITGNNATFTVNNGTINVVNPNGAMVNIYGTDGTMVYSGNSNANITVPTHGVYIVKIGDNTQKVVL